jgi:sodium-dependent dicarboxylate transporter 2/3/5
LPILAGLAVAIKVNPMLLMIPATLAASMAFMLPVATPPNAIIFGTNRIRIIDMVKAGLLLDAISVFIITLVMYYWGTIVFGVDVTVFPDWAITGK